MIDSTLLGKQLLLHCFILKQAPINGVLYYFYTVRIIFVNITKQLFHKNSLLYKHE